ncbi:MAG: hypothetical protein K6F10_00110 [Paludibacteraceae bacterium]|nr:hypothetical protein [Paludibacteraceae bacterium]
MSLSAQTDRDMFDAYLREDMSVWQAYVDTLHITHYTLHNNSLLYEYGFCGYIVAEAKKDGKESLLPEAKRYVANFKSSIINHQSSMPKGHYEMYMSAVLVYELRLHESFHPAKAMSLAKKAAQLAPNDPRTLTYYGTSLFYAPKPFGSKQEALTYFQRAYDIMQAPKWQYCWLKPNAKMYIDQCQDKLKKH